MDVPHVAADQAKEPWMGAAYSQDLRDRVLAAYDRGMTTQPIAKLFQISPAWARRIKQRRRESGELAARPMGGVRVVKIDLEQLRQLVRQQPDATIRQLHQRLGAPCGQSAVGMALSRLGLSFKKRQSMPPSRIGRMLRLGGKSGGKISPSVAPGV
jgi:transposase